MALVDSIITAAEDAYLARVTSLYGKDGFTAPVWLRVAFTGRAEGSPPTEVFQSRSPGVFVEYLYGDVLSGEVGGTVGDAKERFNVYGSLRLHREQLGLGRTGELTAFQAESRKWADKFLRRLIYAGDGLKPSASDEFGWKTGVVRPVVWGIVGVGFTETMFDYLCYVQFIMSLEK